MDAVGARKPGDISAIVDHDDRVMVVRELHDGRRHGEKRGAGHRLRAQLQKARAAAQVRGGQIEGRPAGSRSGVGVEDRAQGVGSRFPP
jgi:hypothetical protein